MKRLLSFLLISAIAYCTSVELAEKECSRRGGQWMGTQMGRGRLAGCNLPTKDAGKPCKRGEDCESVCSTEGKCIGWTMVKGCAHFKGHEGVICFE